MSKRRSPHKRKTKPRINNLAKQSSNNALNTSINNLVAKHARSVCTSAGPMRDQKRAQKKGYRKHKGMEYMAKQFILRLFSPVL